MRRASIITVIVLAMIMATASVAIAKSSKHGVEKQKIVQIFDSSYTAVEPPAVVGKVKLTRSADGVDAKVKVHGLMPGGVYTFWWVVIPEGSATHPHASFIAQGEGVVIGKNGKAKVSMSADVGQLSIAGFPFTIGLAGGGDGLCDGDLSPAPCFRPLDFDLDTAEIHVEIAYHGQESDAGGDLSVWLSDFWTGAACPTGASGHNPGGTTGAHLELSNPGQPHCPVSYVAVFPGTVIP